METKAHHALVGFFVVFLATAGLFFFLWLAQVSFDREFKEYDVVFEGPVRGLRTASEVRFNGIQVGEVTDLGLNPENPGEVIARIRVDETTPVKADSFAQLEPQGLTGLSYIQVSSGSPGAELLEGRPGDRPPRIYARQAQLEGLVEGGETLLENAQIVATRVTRLLSDQNLESFTNTMDNLETLSAQLAENEQMITEMRSAIRRFDEAAVDIQAAAAEIEQFGVTAETFLIDEVGPMVEETEAASIAVNQASTETYESLLRVRPHVEAFADEGLADLTAAAGDLRRLVAVLERIAVELEEDPAGFVGRSRGEEVEVPQ